MEIMPETDWRTSSFAQRLEHVRVNLLDESYAGFRRRLIGDGKDGFDVHYNSVINYHTHTERADKRRDPSLDYVMRVCQVLDIRPAWLLFGEGKPTAAEMATDPATARGADPTIEAVTAAIMNELGTAGLNAGVRWVPLAFLASGFVEEEGGPGSIAAAIGRLARALRAPLDSLGIDPAQVKELDTYLVLVGIALEGALRNAAPSSDFGPSPETED
jgi:hypothetical protein